MTGIVSSFPKFWRVDVVVLRGGGRDEWGNPLPAQEVPVPDCLVAPRATTEPVDRSDLTSSKSVLYRDPGFTFYSTDRIRVPDGTVWQVEGEPQVWPLGVEVPLTKG